MQQKASALDILGRITIALAVIAIILGIIVLLSLLLFPQPKGIIFMG